MTNKTATKPLRAKKTAPAKQDKQADSPNSASKRYAKASLSASTMSAILSESFTNTLLPKTEIIDVAGALSDKITIIQQGDMQAIEAMLIGQAQALQTMFVSLGRQAANKTQLAQYTAFMNLALKAQSQSRATIQALIELKYPKQATFVKQANISNGNQQVNNGQMNKETSTHAPAHAQAITNQHNELLERQNNEWLDNAKTATPSATNQAMATVAT